MREGEREGVRERASDIHMVSLALNAVFFPSVCVDLLRLFEPAFFAPSSLLISLLGYLLYFLWERQMGEREREREFAILCLRISISALHLC